MSEPGTPLESLLGDLASPDYRVRWKAVQGLCGTRDARAFGPLLGALKDRLPTIRIAALSALGRLRDRRAIGPAIAMLEDPNPKVQASAAAALKKFGKAAHAPMLEALRKIDNPRAVDFFHEQLEGLPRTEGDLLAHTLAGADLLNVVSSLARKARAAGNIEAIARAVVAARDALDEHRSGLDAPGAARAAADAGGADEGRSDDAGLTHARADSEAGLGVLRKLESILRDLGRGCSGFSNDR